MTPADDRHTETGGEESRKAGGHSERRYRKAQIEELREASYFLGLPEPLNTTRISANPGGLDDETDSSLASGQGKVSCIPWAS